MRIAAQKGVIPHLLHEIGGIDLRRNRKMRHLVQLFGGLFQMSHKSQQRHSIEPDDLQIIGADIGNFGSQRLHLFEMFQSQIVLKVEIESEYRLPDLQFPLWVRLTGKFRFQRINPAVPQSYINRLVGHSPVQCRQQRIAFGISGAHGRVRNAGRAGRRQAGDQQTGQ